MSTIIKVDASGAALLPADLCQAAGVEPGTDLVAEVQAGRIVLERPRRPFWERIAALTADIPPAELDKSPTDGASQHDHYIYGTPKNEPAIDVLPQTRADFDAALSLYEARPDKGYSLPDCRSMLALRALGVSNVLTNDHHFTQEGFTILFPTP